MRALRKRKPQETQALAFLAVFVYATQAIAFEWKPGCTVFCPLRLSHFCAFSHLKLTTYRTVFESPAPTVFKSCHTTFLMTMVYNKHYGCTFLVVRFTLA